MSHRSYAHKKPVIHSRESSIESRASSSSRSSSDGYHSPTSSRTSMANGYYEPIEHPADGVKYRRVPDNEFKYIKSKTTTSASGRTVEVHDHFKARLVEEPRASNATSEDYKQTQQRKNRK